MDQKKLKRLTALRWGSFSSILSIRSHVRISNRKNRDYRIKSQLISISHDWDHSGRGTIQGKMLSPPEMQTSLNAWTKEDVPELFLRDSIEFS